MTRTLTLLALIAGVAVPAAMAAPGTLNGRLVDENGMTLYFYSMDSHITSNCEEACTNRMRPMLASANDVGFGPLDIMRRRDGQPQWGFRRHPVYRYAGDSKPGDTMGDGMDGQWHQINWFWP
jgi:predicted lipoprotein with Yx(FWY)xxD motif